jgi:hypothetical protein
MANPGRRKLSLIHIPKTAGSYIRTIFKNTNKFYAKRIHGFNGINPKICPDTRKFIGYNANQDYTKDSQFKKLDTFTVVRNPYDLLYSYYSHDRMDTKRYKGKPYSGWMAVNSIHGIKTFEEFINKYCDPNFEWHIPILQEFLFCQIFNQQGKCEPKYIIRYEKLDNGLKYLIDHYNIKVNNKVYNKKVNISPGKSSYKNAYTPEMVEKVKKKCAVELSMFGYDFNGPTDDRTFIEPNTLVYKWKQKRY